MEGGDDIFWPFYYKLFFFRLADKKIHKSAIIFLCKLTHSKESKREHWEEMR